MERLEKNMYKRLLCDNKFQGINDTKDLDHVLGTSGMHTKRYFSVTNKAHLSI